MNEAINTPSDLGPMWPIVAGFNFKPAAGWQLYPDICKEVDPQHGQCIRPSTHTTPHLFRSGTIDLNMPMQVSDYIQSLAWEQVDTAKWIWGWLCRGGQFPKQVDGNTAPTVEQLTADADSSDLYEALRDQYITWRIPRHSNSKWEDQAKVMADLRLQIKLDGDRLEQMQELLRINPCPIHGECIAHTKEVISSSSSVLPAALRQCFTGDTGIMVVRIAEMLGVKSKEVLAQCIRQGALANLQQPISWDLANKVAAGIVKPWRDSLNRQVVNVPQIPRAPWQRNIPPPARG